MSTASKTNQRGHGVIGFQVVENECIWMKAGIVNFRLCDNAYDCNLCAFDKGMRKALRSPDKRADEKKRHWASGLEDRYRDEPRPCRHALTGRASAVKKCPNNYECHHCSFDQWLDEYDEAEYRPMPRLRKTAGYTVAEGYYYHPGHSWARFEHGGRIRVGLDDFVVRLFGPMDKLELPALGASVKQHRHGWNFGRGTHHAKVRSPVSGTVLTVNYRVQDHPEILRKDPYNDGWLAIVDPDPDLPKKNVKGLYFGSDSVHWIENETQKLLGLIGQQYRRLAAAGGETMDDIYGDVAGLEWDVLVETFL